MSCTNGSKTLKSVSDDGHIHLKYIVCVYRQLTFWDSMVSVITLSGDGRHCLTVVFFFLIYYFKNALTLNVAWLVMQ